MRLSRPSSIFIPLLFTSISLALQVTPSSPCSMQCIDNVNDNPTDPNDSNTSGKDLSCNNADYNKTTVGQKFMSCISCLQTSTYSGSGENDQSWFIYNLRYTIDWCLFGYPNNAQTIGGSCLTSTACGPLSMSLESGVLNPNNGSTYDYCTADGGAFMSQSLDPCINCLSAQSDNSYLSNFLVALDAGCRQKPAVGAIIGLNASIFSMSPVSITSPVIPTTSTSSSTSGLSGLSTSAKAGIIVGSIAGFLLLIGIAIIWWKKRRPANAIESSYDPRFGALDISSPNAGGYINPSYQTSPTTQTFIKYNPQDYQETEKSPVKEDANSPTYTDISSSLSGSQPSKHSHSRTSIPVHQAYLPKATLSGDHSSPTSSATLRNSNERRHGLPPSPQLAQRHSRSVSGSTFGTPGPSPTDIPPYHPQQHYKSQRTEEGHALRYQPPPQVPQAPVPLMRPTPARGRMPESPAGVEQWPGSM